MSSAFFFHQLKRLQMLHVKPTDEHVKPRAKFGTLPESAQ